MTPRQTPAIQDRRAFRIAQVVLGAAFVAYWTCLPLLASPVPIDERALVVGGAEARIKSRASEAAALAQRVADSLSQTEGTLASLATALDAAIAPASPDCKFELERAPDNAALSWLLGSAPSRRGSNFESIVIAFGLGDRDARASPDNLAVDAATAHAILRYLCGVPWLSRKVFVVAALEADLSRALEAVLGAGHGAGRDACGTGSLCSTSVQQAIVVHLSPPAAAPPSEPCFELETLGSAGAQPNLDLVAVILRTARLAGVPGNQTGKDGGLGVCSAEQSSHAAARKRRSKGPMAPAYAGRVSDSLSRLLASAAGVSAPAHDAFLRRGVDAASMRWREEGGSEGALAPAAWKPSRVLLLEAVELAVRSLSNLHERFHHATDLYLLLGDGRVVGTGPALLGAALLLGIFAVECYVSAGRAIALFSSPHRAHCVRFAAAALGALALAHCIVAAAAWATGTELASLRAALFLLCTGLASLRAWQAACSPPREESRRERTLERLAPRALLVAQFDAVLAAATCSRLCFLMFDSWAMAQVWGAVCAGQLALGKWVCGATEAAPSHDDSRRTSARPSGESDDDDASKSKHETKAFRFPLLHVSALLLPPALSWSTWALYPRSSSLAILVGHSLGVACVRVWLTR